MSEKKSPQFEKTVGFELVDVEEKHFKILYKWRVEEAHPECHTCRPISPLPDYASWASDMKSKLMQTGLIQKVVVLKEEPNVILGKFTAFDWNERNRSMEIGFYFPVAHRQKGLGSHALNAFVDGCFEEGELNKVYATTSEHNTGAVKILERTQFTLDGKNREHYWIGGNKYDQLVYSLLKKEWVGEK